MTKLLNIIMWPTEADGSTYGCVCVYVCVWVCVCACVCVYIVQSISSGWGQGHYCV